MAIASQIMRRILLQYARRRSAAKRVKPEAGKTGPIVRAGRWEEILAVDEALSRLGELAPQQARIAEMRYFGGLSVEEAAEARPSGPCPNRRSRACAPVRSNGKRFWPWTLR